MIHSEALNTYLEGQAPEEPIYLKELYRQTHLKAKNPQMLSGKVQGRFLSFISKMLAPKNVLEIGTYTGYSALCLAEGLDKFGKLITIDINEELRTLQDIFFKKSPYSKLIQPVLGDAIEIIPKLEMSFDLVFIDADKPRYSKYFDAVIDKMTPNGYIITDNVLWDGKVLDTNKYKDSDTIGIHHYNEKVNNDPRVESLIIPLRDGINLCRVR